jgi:uncharacterized protein involved in outer membrane biogenesis
MAVALIGAIVLLAIALLLYLNFADLSGWRDTVARLASDAIGRELRIDGEFQPEIGLTTRVVATDITLANAAWGDEPQMVTVDRLTGEIDLLSVLFGPITIRDVEIDGARVLFEVDDEGRFNWNLGSGEPGDRSSGQVELIIGHVLAKDLQLRFSRPGARALEAGLSKLEFTDDGTGMLDLDLIGKLEGSPIEISGRLGTFIGLINASRVEHDLSGRLAGSDFTLRGSIDDLSSLSGVETEASISGPDLSRIAASVGVETTVEDSFTVEGSVRQAVAGSNFKLQANVGEMTAKLTGTGDSLVSPSVLDLTVDASGPNVATIGAIAGVEDLPAKAFEVSGRLLWAGFPLKAEDIEVRVGDNTLSAHGVLGKPPLMGGTDFEFTGGGPDISSIVALVGLKVPRESYGVGGRLVRLEHGIGVEKVGLEVGGITVEVDGAVGDPPGYEGTALSFHGEGPNLARLESLLGIQLPPEPFEISGRLTQNEGAIELEGVRARLGETSLQVSGELATAGRFTGSDLHITARGPDASQLARLAGFEAVPGEDFSVEGRVRMVANGYRVHDTVASLGTLNLKADGFIASSPGFVGSDVQIHIDDSDLRHPASIAGVADLPPDPIRIDARLRVEESGYRVTGLEASIGEIGARVDGFVGLPPELEGTDLQINSRGPRVGDLGPYLKQPHLPNVPFSVAGGLRIENAAFLLNSVVAEVGGNRTDISGTVMPGEGLAGTDLSFDSRGPDMSEIEGLVAGFVELGELPRTAYSLTGGVSIDGSGFDLREIELRVGSSIARATGKLGKPPRLLGSDLTIDIDELDTQLLTALTGVTVQAAPFHFTGRVEHDEVGFRFHDVTARLGEYRAAVDGTLGELPKLIGTNLEIHASGPDTDLYKELTGLPGLPDQPFTLDGEFRGTPERFSTRDFMLRFGPSDIEGSFTVDIAEKPTITARLTSKLVDLSRLRERLEDAETISDETDEVEAPKPTKGTLLIPDEALNLGWLSAVNADVAVRAKTLALRAKRFYDLNVDVHLEDGRLEIERATAVGSNEGEMTGSMSLEAVADQYRFDTDFSFRQIRLDIPGHDTQPMAQPPIDIDFNLEAVGRTPHELASSANGALQLVVGKGVVDSSILDVVTADILLTLLNAFNPFSKTDPTTELQCGVALLSIEDGLASLEPMAFQSDKMTLLGDGKVDLRTEKLNLHWITKPRKGLGISASMLTNPYIKLGGTLANPSIELKPLEAVTSTGVAVATMGISLVAKGLFDRITAERKVCQKALQEIEARTQASSGPPARTN